MIRFPSKNFTSSRGTLPLLWQTITHAHTLIHIKDTKQTHTIKHTQRHTPSRPDSPTNAVTRDSWGRRLWGKVRSTNPMILDDLGPELFTKCRFLKSKNHWCPGPTTPRISLLSFIYFVFHFGYTLRSRIYCLLSFQMISGFYSNRVGRFRNKQGKKKCVFYSEQLQWHTALYFTITH